MAGGNAWKARCSAVLATLVSLWLGLSCANNPPAAARQTHCQLIITGDGKGGITDARMPCTAGPVGFQVAINATLLGRFQHNFAGAVDSSSCAVTRTPDFKHRCLVTVCSGTLVLRDSKVEAVNVKDPSKYPHSHVVCVLGSSELVVINSTFSHNGWRPLASYDTGHIKLIGSNLSNNVVEGDGGGMHLGDNASAIITGGSSVHGNNATMFGGGVAVGDNSSVIITGGSKVHGNSASVLGGGVAAGHNTQVIITGSTSVFGNNAEVFGGGVASAYDANVVISGGSRVHGNTAGAGGGVAAGGSSSMVINSSSVYGNNALASGGGVGVGFTANVTITNSSVYDNTASQGGGFAAKDDANVTITDGSRVYGNTAALNGGGVGAVENATITVLDGSRICHNKAQKGRGGGLSIASNRTILLSGITICNNSCISGVGGGLFVGFYAGNAKFDRTGQLLNRTGAGDGPRGSWWANVTTKVIIANTSITNNTSINFPGGGIGVAAKVHVVLLGGSRVIGNKVANGSGGGAVVFDNATLEVMDGVVFSNNSVMQRYVGSAIAAFDSSHLLLPARSDVTKCSAGVYLGRTPCGPGEEFNPDLGVCECCRAHSYSFDNTTCQQCPSKARCSNGMLVDPIAGYWKSHPTSVEIHKCPLFDQSCRWNPPDSLCADGYAGPLCGVCKLPEYGMVSPLRCHRCMLPRTQLGLYLLLSVVTVVFVAITVHVTWKDNLSGQQTMQATDLIKVVVQFLQYIVIIGGVSIPWPDKLNLQVWFQVAASVFGAASGQALSLDCWLAHFTPSNTVPLAVQRQLVYFIAPVAIFAAVVALQCLCWVVLGAARAVASRMQQRRDVRASSITGSFLVVRKLPVTALVVAYYAYPTLLRAALGFFACLRIDVRPGMPGATAILNHRYGYWILDIRQQCFSGYHLPWALGLGLPAAFLLCVCVPAAMAWGFQNTTSKANAAAFDEHFGFLYRNYKPECTWWEAVWATQTVVLTLVSVFSFTIDRYFSILSLLVAFLVSAALQGVFRPYAEPLLHRMHLISSSCLAATTIGALAMFAYEVSDVSAGVVRMVVAVLVLIMNVMFVGWCVLKLAPTAGRSLTSCLPRVKAASLSAATGALGFVRANGTRGQRPNGGGARSLGS